MKKYLLAAAMMVATGSAANATLITGSYTITSGGPVATDELGTPFSLDLIVGTPQTFDFANIFQDSTSSHTVVATFDFTLPNSGSNSVTGLDVAVGPGKGALHLFTDAIVWGSGGKIETDFSNGAILDTTLDDEAFAGRNTKYSGLNVPVTFDLIKAPTPVPEPGTLTLFATALLCFTSLFWLRKSKRAR